MKPFTLGELTADLIYVKETHTFHNVDRPYLAFRQNELPNRFHCRAHVDTITFRPGHLIITESPDGRPALNLWRRRYPNGRVGDVAPFLKFVDAVFGPQAPNFLLWLAHIIQFPHQSPPYHWLHTGDASGEAQRFLANCLERIWEAEFTRTHSGAGLGAKLMAVTKKLPRGDVMAATRAVGGKYPAYNRVRFIVFASRAKRIPAGFRLCDHKVSRAYWPPFSLTADEGFINAVHGFLLRHGI